MKERRFHTIEPQNRILLSRILLGMRAKAHKGYKVERKALSTIDLESAKADMGYKNGLRQIILFYAIGPLPSA